MKTKKESICVTKTLKTFDYKFMLTKSIKYHRIAYDT